MFMKVIKVKNVSAEPQQRSEIVFSHLDGEICFSGRGSYSSLMKRAIALVSIFPCKSNKLFGHGRRTASSWRGGGTREEKEIHPALAYLRAAGMYADVVAGWKDTTKFCFCRRRSVFAPKLFLMSFERSAAADITSKEGDFVDGLMQPTTTPPLAYRTSLSPSSLSENGPFSMRDGE